MAETDLFFSRTGMDRTKVQETVDTALSGADDGELFLECSQSESFSYDDGRLKAATFDTSQGFGLRAVAGDATGYAHATELSEDAIARAARTVRAVSGGHSGTVAGGPARSNVKLYTDLDPLETAGFEKKVKLLEEMNEYARGRDSRVRQVSASLSGEWQRIEILRAGGEHYSDTSRWCASMSRWWWNRMAVRKAAASAAAAAAAMRPISIHIIGGRRWTRPCASLWQTWTPCLPRLAR